MAWIPFVMIRFKRTMYVLKRTIVKTLFVGWTQMTFKIVLAPVETVLRCPAMHYGIRADILKKKAIRKCSTLKIDFSANFHLTHDFFLAEALLTPQKLENANRNLQTSIKGSLKLKKREGGVFHG